MRDGDVAHRRAMRDDKCVSNPNRKCDDYDCSCLTHPRTESAYSVIYTARCTPANAAKYNKQQLQRTTGLAVDADSSDIAPPLKQPAHKAGPPLQHSLPLQLLIKLQLPRLRQVLLGQPLRRRHLRLPCRLLRQMASSLIGPGTRAKGDPDQTRRDQTRQGAIAMPDEHKAGE